MQIDLNHLPKLYEPHGYHIREMDTNKESDINKWIFIINNAYDDAIETSKTFKQHLYNHRFLETPKIFFLYNDSNQEVGTITAGLYKNNNSYGGDARIAILPAERGNGLGLFLIIFAFHYLKELGAKYGESIISYHRKSSIILHLKCGFRPQFDREKIIYDNQKRMWPIRLLAKKGVRKLFKSSI